MKVQVLYPYEFTLLSSPCASIADAMQVLYPYEFTLLSNFQLPAYYVD